MLLLLIGVASCFYLFSEQLNLFLGDNGIGGARLVGVSDAIDWTMSSDFGKLGAYGTYITKGDTNKALDVSQGKNKGELLVYPLHKKKNQIFRIVLLPQTDNSELFQFTFMSGILCLAQANNNELRFTTCGTKSVVVFNVMYEISYRDPIRHKHYRDSHSTDSEYLHHHHHHEHDPQFSYGHKHGGWHDHSNHYNHAYSESSHSCFEDSHIRARY